MIPRLKQRQLEALKARNPTIRWGMPDGTVLEELYADFAARPVYAPYLPLYTTPDLQLESKKGCGRSAQ